MNLKIFKNKTNSLSKEKNIHFFSMANNFEYLKIKDIINYYKLDVIIYNNEHNVFHKCIIRLKDIDIFDDQLSIQNRSRLKQHLKDLLVDTYFKFKVTNNSRDFPEMILYSDKECLVSVNTIMANKMINCLVLKDKMRKINNKYDIEEGQTFKNKKNLKHEDKVVFE